MTKAEYARYVSRILHRAATEMSELSKGMWNPDFCAADAQTASAQFATDIRACLNAAEGHDQRKYARA